MGVLPPRVKPEWDDIDAQTQARMLAFNDIKNRDALERDKNFWRSNGADIK